MSRLPLTLLIACWSAPAPPPVTPPPGHCRQLEFSEAAFTVCSFDARTDHIGLFHTANDALPYGQFDRLGAELAEQGRALTFATNGGMYHEDRRPVGLYMDAKGTTTALQLKESVGNFGMLPNGVLHSTEGQIAVTESHAFKAIDDAHSWATQSGPMLVLEGALHPKFSPDSESKKRRNGVGVEGTTVHFAISDEPVNFHTFARLFRDELHTPNALYLDGVVSRMFSTELIRHERGAPLGPFRAVWE